MLTERARSPCIGYIFYLKIGRTLLVSRGFSWALATELKDKKIYLSMYILGIHCT